MKYQGLRQRRINGLNQKGNSLGILQHMYTLANYSCNGQCCLLTMGYFSAVGESIEMQNSHCDFVDF